ncbi:MAG: L7Ae/L30e/S12e/Gadd45 family protein [Firmicutes bacterium HGW-Firmicutes-12]|jgi:ribosomal protein L7Ae-like RNA K-turn-binding protein|nr:MAG: L7Ae/L30e/S12e/Gadd45 family protein [Firmicutes bacterium HGW-Firmicutes-12]
MTILNEVYTLLGFARKSGKLFAGESAVKAAVKNKNAKLVILAEDLPEKRKIYWSNYLELSDIKVVNIGTKEDYGRVLGLSERGLIAISDKKMAAAILEKIMRANKIEDKLNGGD